MIAATSLPDGTDTSGLSISGANGLFRIASNQLILDLARLPISTPCGDTTIRAPVSPGVANMETVCDSTDGLRAASDISVTADKVAIFYRGTQAGGTGNVRSISNTGSGGEVHIESGSVARTDTGDATSVDAVTLSNTGTDVLRFVLASGASVSNADTTAGSDAIVVSASNGEVSLSLAGDTSAVGGEAIRVFAAQDVDIDVTGGTHTSPNSVIWVSIGDSGAVDVDITGGVLYGGSSSAAVIALQGISGVDTLDIGSGVVVCRGSYSASACNPGASGLAVSLSKESGSQAGSVTFKNAGSIFGGISTSTTVTSAITNESGGAIVGSFIGGAGSDVVTNAGIWTLAENFDFGGSTDSFTNSGTFIVHYTGTTLVMNNLESFTLNSGGTLRFSLANNTLPSHALLNIGGATPILSGTIEVFTRDVSDLPHSGSLALITGTSLSGSTDFSNLRIASGISGSFSVVNRRLILTFTIPPCGSQLRDTRRSCGDVAWSCQYGGGVQQRRLP